MVNQYSRFLAFHKEMTDQLVGGGGSLNWFYSYVFWPIGGVAVGLSGEGSEARYSRGGGTQPVPAG